MDIATVASLLFWLLLLKEKLFEFICSAVHSEFSLFIKTNWSCRCFFSLLLVIHFFSKNAASFHLAPYVFGEKLTAIVSLITISRDICVEKLPLLGKTNGSR